MAVCDFIEGFYNVRRRRSRWVGLPVTGKCANRSVCVCGGGGWEIASWIEDLPGRARV
jgi:hypothetical protein